MIHRNQLYLSPYILILPALCPGYQYHWLSPTPIQQRSVYSHDRRVLSTPVGYSHDDQSEAR